MSALFGENNQSERKVKIRLLGPPEMIADGKPVVIKRKLNRVLLFYLAAQQYPVSREELCALFWPEESEQTARKNLREALSRIRTETGINHLIIADGEQVSLNPAVVWVDYHELNQLISPLLSSSEMTSTISLPDWMVIQMKRGMDLYRTSRFMQGISIKGSVGFDNWLDLINQSYNLTVLKVIDRLIDHYISTGNLEEALIWLGKATEIVPIDEDFNYLTLICMRDTGKIQELIDYCNYLEKIYAQQQETFPERFGEIKQEAMRTRIFHDFPDTDWPDAERGVPDFVGRVEELDILNKVLRRRGILLLQGEAGIGKTRLLRHFYEQQPFRPRLIYCRSHPLGLRVPFHTIVQYLHSQVLDEDWQGLEESDRTRLSNFYHNELQGMEGPHPVRPGDTWLPVLEDVFHSFLKLMEVTAARRPLLFVLDNAMYVDLASISLVSFLIEHGFFDRYGMLVIAISPDVENAALNQLMQRVRRARKLISISLGPFNDKEIKGFIQNTVGRIPSEEIVDRMNSLTGGNPFFLTECVRTAKWEMDGHILLSIQADCTPPETVTALVRDKEIGLEAESQTLLKAAAILGKKFWSDVLEEMVGMDADRVATGLQELIHKGFLNVNTEIRPLGGYTFRHDVEREVILMNLTPSQKRSLHLKAAMALQKRRMGFSRFAEALARHWEVSLQQSEALSAWLEAGRYERSQFNRNEVYRVYGNGLDLIMKAPTLFPEKAVYELINEYGNYAYDRDDMVTCERIYRNCLEIGEVNQNRKLIGTAYNGLARTAFYLNKFEEARTCAERASWFLEGTDLRVEKIKSLFIQGSIQYNMDDFISSRRLLEKTLALAEDVDDLYINDTKIDILTILCAVLCYIGEPVLALDLSQQMVNLSSLATRRSTALQAAAVLAMCEYFNDHLDKTVQIYQESLVLMGRFQLRFWCSLLDTSTALAYLEMGNLDEAYKLGEQAYVRETPYKNEKLSMHTAKVLGDLFRLLENTARSSEYYFENINSAAMNYQTIITRYYYGILLIDAGTRGEGQKWIDRAISEAEQNGLRGIESSMKMGRLVLATEKKPSAAMVKEAQKALEMIKETKSSQTRFFQNALKGHLAGASGKTDEAIGYYQQAVLTENTNGNVWLELNGYKRILALASPGSPTWKSTEKAVNEIMERMQAHATHPAIKGSFIKFRNRWKKYVNGLSTKGGYKNNHT